MGWIWGMTITEHEIDRYHPSGVDRRHVALRLEQLLCEKLRGTTMERSEPPHFRAAAADILQFVEKRHGGSGEEGDVTDASRTPC
jgi:hypothetical protein